MFKTAPRYLSGVSVFYGDDITKRETDGELVIFVGQASKGPSVPVQLQNVDNAIGIYGSDNPLAKAIYEFYDGYLDSGKNQNLKYVTLRVGGIPSSLVTSYGLTLLTSDAYDGIENDYFIYVNNTSPEAMKVKIWDKNRLLVYDSFNSINTGHFVDSAITLPVGDGGIGAIYGVDIDSDPLATPVTIAQLVLKDAIDPNGSPLSPTGAIGASDSTIVVTDDVTLFPSSGTLKITETTGVKVSTVFVDYSALDTSTKTFTLDSEVGVAFTDAADISLIGSVLIKGDSELNLTNRKLYEKMRNALLEIEMYTPDYIVPGGAVYNATEQYSRVYNERTTLKQNITDASEYLIVDAAADWPVTGIVDILTSEDIHNYMKYTSISATGADFRIDIAKPSFNITAGATDGSTSITLTAQVGNTLADVLSAGYIKIGTSTYHYTVEDSEQPGVLTLGTALTGDAIGAVTGQKVPGTALANISDVATTFTKLENFELGIGFVKETYQGDKYTFSWSDTKLPGYYVAHFGYMFARFCNDAAIGYNTPLCGMNVTVPARKDRASIVSWIGKMPTFKVRVDNQEAVEAVVANGAGLLGDPTFAGSVKYNRVYMSDFDAGKFADPAYGLLLTDDGAGNVFIDCPEIKDGYNNVIDLGKFLCVGAGLVTFSNRGSTSSYIDSCGVYALGMLAGKPKAEGISFSRIGSGSNATVTVIVNRNQYNDLAQLGYIVVTREKGLGWVINNGHSAARNDSAYYLISTTRTLKYVVEGKRAILVNFIGKPVNRLIYEAAKTRLAESFSEDVKKGLLATNALWDLVTVEAAKAIGKFELRCQLNPALELTQVTIDATIERENAFA